MLKEQLKTFEAIIIVVLALVVLSIIYPELQDPLKVFLQIFKGIIDVIKTL